MKYGIDVFHGGALNRSVSTAGATTASTASVFGVKLGVGTEDLEVFATVGISSNAKVDTQVGGTALIPEYKGKLSIDLGATYTMDEMTYLAKFTTFGTEVTTGTTAASTVTTGNTMAFGLGAGWKKEASKSVTMFTRLQLDYQKDTTKQKVGAAAESDLASPNTTYNVPIVIAAEAQATSWLAIRGALSHSLIGQHQSGLNKDSLNNMTSVAMGLGFNFGDLTIDALAGQTGAVANATGTSESSQGNTQAGNKFGFGNDMLTRLSMTYNF